MKKFYSNEASKVSKKDNFKLIVGHELNFEIDEFEIVPNSKPLLVLDVNISKEEKAKFVHYENDSVAISVGRFGKRHSNLIKRLSRKFERKTEING